jgi:hypothetical protein
VTCRVRSSASSTLSRFKSKMGLVGFIVLIDDHLSASVLPDDNSSFSVTS